jgi:hypothetical protein
MDGARAEAMDRSRACGDATFAARAPRRPWCGIGNEQIPFKT